MRWTPPPGWVRVVAWVHPDERKILKRLALEADTSVAQLVRAVARGVGEGALTRDELLHHIKRGVSVMDKIPTIFERDENFKVMNKPRESCDWVFRGEGRATEKIDGTNVRVTVRSGEAVRLEKRRNPDKVQKKKGIIDAWYTDAVEGPEDKYIYEALRNTDVTEWPDGEHSCEAIGPKVQGNPLGLEQHLLVPFNLAIPEYASAPRDYEGLKVFLEKAESLFAPGHLAEGIVFHHPDGRRAKIKRKDFAF